MGQRAVGPLAALLDKLKVNTGYTSHYNCSRWYMLAAKGLSGQREDLVIV